MQVSFSHVSGAVISEKQHSDKKPLEWYGKDSDNVHHRLLIEFISEKLNAERLIVIEKSEYYLIGKNLVFVSVLIDISECVSRLYFSRPMVYAVPYNTFLRSDR